MTTTQPDHAKILREVESLRELTVPELREKWVEVWGEPCRSNHKVFLQRRIAWKIQANVYGGLSQRALERARELADETFLKLQGVGMDGTQRRPAHPSARNKKSGRQLLPGSTITRTYQGRKISVLVLDSGFEWEGRRFKSLSAVAHAITGAHWSGPLFFGLTRKEAA